MTEDDQWRYTNTYYRDPSSPFFMPPEWLRRSSRRPGLSEAAGAALVTVACPIFLFAIGDWVAGLFSGVLLGVAALALAARRWFRIQRSRRSGSMR